MTDDRQEFAANRDAGLRARHETREARAVRKQVAEEIAVAIEAKASDTSYSEPEEVTEHLLAAAQTAREIGSKEPTARPCKPGCEFVAPHPSHPCGQYTRERS